MGFVRMAAPATGQREQIGASLYRSAGRWAAAPSRRAAAGLRQRCFERRTKKQEQKQQKDNSLHDAAS
jgi:hypothetical protein